jgi:hypothetical protein
MDQLLGKQEKMGKVVGRVKLLLEKEEGERSSPTNGKAAKVKNQQKILLLDYI